MAIKNNKQEIIWNVINSLLAGLLVSLGAIVQAMSSQDLNFRTVCIALAVGLISGLIVAITKFKAYWSSQESEYQNHLFSFYSS